MLELNFIDIFYRLLTSKFNRVGGFLEFFEPGNNHHPGYTLFNNGRSRNSAVKFSFQGKLSVHFFILFFLAKLFPFFSPFFFFPPACLKARSIVFISDKCQRVKTVNNVFER